jgi:hypothetical protein
MSSSHVRAPGFPFATGTIRNIRITDTTGKAKYCVVSLNYNQPGAHAPRRYLIEDVVDQGKASHFFLPGALGTHGVAEISLNRVSAELVTGLFASEDPTQKMRLSVTDFTNRAAKPVPVKTYYDGHRAAPALQVKPMRGRAVKGVLD